MSPAPNLDVADILRPLRRSDNKSQNGIESHQDGQAAFHALQQLQQLDAESLSNLPLPEQCDVIYTLVSFTDNEQSVPKEFRDISLNVLEHWQHPNIHILEYLFAHNIKDAFRSNPHPNVNLSTGRKAPRPAGGVMATQDFLEDQGWKDCPGICSVVFWCVTHWEADAYEKHWHLLVPPIMTILDDYETKYKLWGVKIVHQMLQSVPSSLLKRTGIGTLFSLSLHNCLNRLHNSETPELIQNVIPATLLLIELITESGGAERYDMHCKLLGEGIIGTVWLYSSDSESTILATIEALPSVLDSIGIGCARYLKALIPQLTFPLMPAELKPVSKALQISSLRALTSLMEICSPRIGYWQGTILNAIAQCWVTTSEEDLRAELCKACKKLVEVSPSVEDDLFPRLMNADKITFGPMVEQTLQR